ncbi:MAG: hypothetical protein Q8L40_07050 [Burkholderiales bacterium]|nr:hypothetical protein [Burkholderiales bacterium]
MAAAYGRYAEIKIEGGFSQLIGMFAAQGIGIRRPALIEQVLDVIGGCCQYPRAQEKH